MSAPSDSSESEPGAAKTTTPRARSRRSSKPQAGGKSGAEHKVRRTCVRRRVGNGKTRRTPQQLERQERVFMLSVMQGLTIRQIAAQLEIDTHTVMRDIRAEELRRSDELAARRENEKARAVGFYADIAKRALRKSDLYDQLVEAGLRNPETAARVTDRALEPALQARTRIDKILGLDAPTKVDIGLQTLLDAIGGDDDLSHPLVGTDQAEADGK